jgi:hypothetical protein
MSNNQLITELRKESKGANTRDEITTVLEKIYARKSEVWQELEKLTDLHTKLEERRAKIDSETLFPTDEDITPEKVMSLNWEEVTGALYKKVSNWFYTFKYVGNSGYVPETKQPSIQLRFYADQPVEPQIAEVMQFVPHLKKFTPEHDKDELDNIRFLDIMEHTLSAGGSFSIYILDDDTAILTVMRYHRFSVLKKFENIEECCRYVHQHHPYEKVGGDDEDDQW